MVCAGADLRIGFQHGAQLDDDAEELRSSGEQNGSLDRAPAVFANLLHVRPPPTPLQRSDGLLW